MNIVVPLAGKDKNFEEKGLCKPLVEVKGKPSIVWIAESRPFSYSNAIFIILKEHQRTFNLDKKLYEFFGEKIKVAVVDQPTAGAPQTILLLKDIINTEEELIIDLPDQYIDFGNLMGFIKENQDKFDGLIPTFKSSYYNRGYMIIGKDGFVQKVSEKDKVPISEDSTACISYFKHGKDFVSSAEKMIEKKRTATNGAYLISPAFNELIEEGKKIVTFPCDFISTLGTVEGIAAFEQHLKPIKKLNSNNQKSTMPSA